MLKTIDDKSFLRFGRPINIEENFEFLVKYNCEEKKSSGGGTTYIVESPVYMEKISGQAVINCAVKGKEREFFQFFFDSPLVLNSETIFSLTPLTDDFSYIVYYFAEPKVLKTIKYDYPKPTKHINVTSLFSVGKKKFPNGVVFRKERQPFWEFTYIIQGNVTRMVGENSYELGTNYLQFVPANADHSMTSDDSGVEMLIVMFDLDTTMGDNLVKSLKATPHIKRHIESIMEKIGESTPFSDEAIADLISLIIIEVLLTNGNSNADHAVSQSVSIQMEKIIGEAERIVDGDVFDSELSVKTISEKLFVSQSYLYRCAMSRYGTGFSEYIQNRKLEVAKRLIVSGNYSLSEIANNLNFCSQSYFSTQFKKKYGMSPLQYSRLYGHYETENSF